MPLGDLEKEALAALAFLAACHETEHLLEQLPAAEMGCLYLEKHLRPVLPDPHKPEFKSLLRHFASMKGSTPEIKI